MPWQMAPPMLIILGCFTTTGVLLGQIDTVAFGRPHRTRVTQYEGDMDNRDVMILREKEKMRRAAEEYAKKAAKEQGISNSHSSH